MPLRIEVPWYPTVLRGNYLYWKNARTGETRKSYISQGELAGIKKDLNKYRKLTSGLGYPWVPVRYDGTYIYYKSSVSGLETKSFVPPEMRADVARFLKLSLGEPGKARVLDLYPVGKAKYKYIERGDFTMLREAMTARDRTLSGFSSNPYTIRTGNVTNVYEGNLIELDNKVLVKLRYTETPKYDAKNITAWQQSKDYTTTLLPKGTNVTLKILINQSRDNTGNTLADVFISDTKNDVAEKIMQAGLAPIKSTEPQNYPIKGLEWLATPMYGFWASTENFATYLDSSGKTLEDNKFMLWLAKQSVYYDPSKPQYKIFGGTWGTKDVTDRRTPGKIQREIDLKEDARLNRTPSEEELARREKLYSMMDVAGDPMMWGSVISAPFKYVLKPGFVKFAEYLNKFDIPPVVYDTGWGWLRAKRLFRQSVTLYNPIYHIGNFIGDSFNAFLGGLRNPKRIAEAHTLLTLPPTTDGARIVFTSVKGKPYTVAALRVFEEQYHFEKIGMAGQTTAEVERKVDIFDKLFAPGQKLAEYENARLRYAAFLDRLQKGDEVEQAYAHSKRFLINYDKRSLTAIEQTWFEPNIPFYMWMRQNTVLQSSQIISQPQTYGILAKTLQPLAPTPEEISRLAGYQQNYIFIRNPFDPKTFIRIRLPIEDLALFDNRLSTPEKAALILYPHLSLVLETMVDRNFFDNSRPSKNYPLYIAKKFSGGWYWKYRDFVTLEPEEAMKKHVGLGAIEPRKEEYLVGKLLMDAGMAKTYEQMNFEREEKLRKDKVDASAFVQRLMENQTALSPALRDRPNDFGGFDWLGFPEFSLQAEAINFMTYLKTGKWGTMKYTEKIGAGNIFRKLYEEKLYVGRMRMRETWGKPGEYLDVSGGFLIELAGNVAGDPLSVIGYGRGLLTKVWQVGAREFPLSHAGEQLYITLRRTRGEKEARWLTIQAARSNLIKYTRIGGKYQWVNLMRVGTPNYIQTEGLRILGTNLEFISQPTVQAITSPIWKYGIRYPIIQPIKYIAEGLPPRLLRLIEVLKNIGRKQDVITLEELQEVKIQYKQMTDRKRLEKQLTSADIWILKQEARQTFTEIKEANIASAMDTLKQYKEISKKDLQLQKELMQTISEFKTSQELDFIREALELELKASQVESRVTLKFIAGEFKTDLDTNINRLTKSIALADIRTKMGLDIYDLRIGTKAVEQTILENSRKELQEMKVIRKAIESANIDALSAQVGDELFINQEWNRFYGDQITNLIERGESQTPKIGIITRTLEKYNKQYALRETERGLLTSERGFYMRHWMTKEAREFFDIQEPVLGKLAVKKLFDIERKTPGSIDEINEIYRKKYGFNLFESNAFKIQEYRAFESIEATETYDYLMWVKQTYGISLEQDIATTFIGRFFNKNQIPSGYIRSKIPLLNDIYLPKPIVQALESDPMFAMHIKTTRPKSYFERTLWYSDTAQRTWKFGVTFLDPNWLPSNVQSGLYVAWAYAHIYRLSSYTNAWTELARRSEVLSRVFKLSREGGVITDVYGEKILASDLIVEAKKAGVLGVEGAADISRNYKFSMKDSLFNKIWQTASWALKNSEDIVRFPVFYDMRINKGFSVEEATSIVMHTQGNYGKSAISPFESQVMTRLTNFYVWYKFAPTLVAKQLISEPRTLTVPYHLMNSWNGDRGDVERQYLTDRQLTRMVFRISGTDAYTTPAIFSLANSAYKLMYAVKSKERGFYWDELKRDPDLLLRFLKNEVDVDWLNRGAGRVTVEGNKATIMYVETGDTISARVDSNRSKLVIMDDMTGSTLKEFPFENTEGKFGIYKEMSFIDTVERVMGEYGARTLVMPIELTVNRDFKFGSPIEDRWQWISNQFYGKKSSIGRSWSELFDPTIDWREKIADLTIGWFIDHLRDNPMIPRQDLTEDAVTKVIGIKIWEVERGDYLGCGA